MTDDELREQLALYAAGALSDDERRELEEIVSGRPDLQAELAELQDAARVLADAVAEGPPPTFRGRVLERIAQTPQLPPLPPADEHVAPAVPIGKRRRNRFVLIGAAAAAVIAIVVGLIVVSPWSTTQKDPTAAVLQANDAQTIAMPGTLPGVTIVHSADHDASVLQAPDIPVPNGDKVYELWAIRDGAAHRYVTFRPEVDGKLSVYAAGLDPASADTWAITEEPAGGSDSPTPPILNQTA